MIPRPVPPSSESIAIAGGFSYQIHPDWHESKLNAENEIKLKCLTNNIVMSSLSSWWYSFKDVHLVRFAGIKDFCESTGNTNFNYTTFIKITDMYREKSKALLKDVWHRGAMLIVKKFKFLAFR